LFDEPDAHLHEGRKKEIFDLIRQDYNSQFIISSHSPTLTKLFESDHVVFLEKTESGTRVSYGDVSSTISALTDGEWSYIDHSIFFDKSRPLVLVEGEGDVKYIRKAIELLSKEKKEYEILKTEYAGHAKELAAQFHKEDNVCIYATGGDGTLWEVVNGLNPEVSFSSQELYATISLI
jgi:predicted ATP-dependent endonuclease of OLD family